MDITHNPGTVGVDSNTTPEPERLNGPVDAPADPGTSRAPHATPEAATRAAETQNEATTDHARAAAHFASDAKTHTLTTHRDDGAFRHLEFTGLAGLSRIVVVTWPYNLLVAGSHGSFHFERFGPDTEDMFNWLRGIRVEPSSWASKLVNGADSVREYDRDLLVQQVKDEVAEAVREGAPRGLRAAVREQILESDWLHSKDMAMRLVYDFEHGTTYRSECTCGASQDHSDRSAAFTWEFYKHPAKRLDGEHKVTVRETGGFAFSDVGDWSIHKLDYHFVYQCHAIVWAIGQYDAARKAEPDFFQPGHTYLHTPLRWRFRCDAVTTHPDTGARVAVGWSLFAGHDKSQTGDMSEEIWAEGGWTDVTEVGEVPA